MRTGGTSPCPDLIASSLMSWLLVSFPRLAAARIGDEDPPEEEEEQVEWEVLHAAHASRMLVVHRDQTVGCLLIGLMTEFHLMDHRSSNDHRSKKR